MWFRIDPGSGLPVYRQIVEQVRRGVASGLLKPGEQIPTVRDLAVQLAINFNTVSRAYIELQRSGVIVTGAGRGSFIATHLSPPTDKSTDAKAELIPEMDRMLVAAYHLGLTPPDVLQVLQERILQIMEGKRSSPVGMLPQNEGERVEKNGKS